MPDTLNMDWSTHGTRVEIASDEEYLYIRVPITEDAKASAGPSQSGKTNVLGSTNGFVKLGGGMSVSLNMVIKPSPSA